MTEGGDFIWMDLQFPEPIRRDAGTGFRTSVNMTHYV